MSHSHIDPDADPSRRAWLACPHCDHGAGCRECQSTRNCANHWQYLLKNTASRVFLQCPTCLSVWTVDTAERDRHDRIQTAEPDDVVVATVLLGDRPHDIATSPGGDLIYVLTADSVKAVNSLHHVVASIPIGDEPKQMIMSSDGRRIYVTGYDGALSIIDVISMTAKTVAKQRSTAAAVSPEGDYIYLAHGEAIGDGGSAWVSATRADGTTVAFAAIDGFITGMAVSPNGRRLYVASTDQGDDRRGGAIVVVDTASYKAVDFIAVAEAPEAITVDADGLLYVTHFNSNSVSVVDPATHCGIAVHLDDAPMEVVARPDTKFIYTANSHSVTMIDATTMATTSIMVGELPRRLALAADGQRLYATDFANGTVWCLDTSDHSVVTTFPVGAHPAAVKLSPDGKFLYVTDARDGTLSVISTTLVKPTA